MACCDCESTGEALARSRAQRRVLWTVLFINLAIFVGEFGAGLWADSTALQGDSLDSLGDALVYALSLWTVGQALRWRAGSAVVTRLADPISLARHQHALSLAVLAQ